MRTGDAGRGTTGPSWSRTLLPLLAVLVTLVAGGCQLIRQATQTSPWPPTPRIEVSLGIYSGRTDPSWTLTAAESAELRRLLSSLPTTIGEPPQGGLGYHGFVLTTADAGRTDQTLVAYRGAIADVGSGSRTYLVDEDRAVERYLLDTGRTYLSAGEVNAVETDLTATTAD
jgi:hypothetical protein